MLISLQDKNLQTFLRELQGGSVAVVLFRSSSGNTPARIDRSLRDLGLTSAVSYDCFETFEGK